MNPHEFFRTHIGALVAHGFAVDAVRGSLDLKGASEVWGGPDTDDHPAWYFWLTSAPGAYRLRLVHAETREHPQGPTLHGVLSVKYYPACVEPVFRRFSPRERSLITGGAFDETNTPKLEHRSAIPERLFSVATIELTHDVRCGQSFLEYTSLDRMCFRDGRRVTELGELGPSEAADEPRVRQLPAWDLGYPMFDAIVGLHVFLTRRAPKRVVLSRQPGFELVEALDGDYEPRDSEDVAFKSLLLAFSPADAEAPSPIESTMISRQLAAPWTPMLDTMAPWVGAGKHRPLPGHDHDYDRDLGPSCGGAEPHDRDVCGCDRDHRVGTGASVRTVKVGAIHWEVPLAFNDQWWKLAVAEPAANAMPCGCH